MITMDLLRRDPFWTPVEKFRNVHVHVHVLRSGIKNKTKMLEKKSYFFSVFTRIMENFKRLFFILISVFTMKCSLENQRTGIRYTYLPRRIIYAAYTAPSSFHRRNFDAEFIKWFFMLETHTRNTFAHITLRNEYYKLSCYNKNFPLIITVYAYLDKWCDRILDLESRAVLQNFSC